MHATYRPALRRWRRLGGERTAVACIAGQPARRSLLFPADSKKTGRYLFSLARLADKLRPFAAERPADIQITLTEFTVYACVAGVTSYGKESKELIVCGGGAFNVHLLERLQAGLPWLRVSTSEQHGLPP